MCHAWELVYTGVYRTEQDAINRERKLKHHGSGLVEIKKRIIHTLDKLN